VPDPSLQYFDDFSAYLRSGDTAHLAEVFPQADDLNFAAVYRNGYLKGCIDALRASYPVVDRLVGEDYFNFMAGAYVELHPPAHSSFAHYGDHFPDFVAAQVSQHQLSYLADCACLDQAWLRAYFAPDSILLSAMDVEQWQAQGNDIAELGVCLPQSVQLLHSTHAISTLWSLLKSGEDPAEGLMITPVAESQLAWRDAQDAVNVRVLNDAERAFITPLLDGADLGAAATQALQLDAEFPVIDFFSELLDSDLLAVK